MLIHSIGDETGLRHYLPAVRKVIEYAESEGADWSQPWEIDALLSDLFDQMYYDDDHGNGSFSQASFALNGLTYLDPSLKGQLPDSWRSLKAWSKLEPPGEGKPIPFEALAVIADHMRKNGEPECALMVELATDSWLRSQDLGLLRVGDIKTTFSPSTKIFATALSLGVAARGERTKTGPRQGVTIDHSGISKRLRGFAAGRDNPEKLFKTTSAKMGKVWRATCKVLSLELGPFHSIRHSGPSRDHLLGYRNLDDIRKRGRWRVAASVNRYSKNHVYIEQMAILDEKLLAKGQELIAGWGDRPTVAR